MINVSNIVVINITHITLINITVSSFKVDDKGLEPFIPDVKADVLPYTTNHPLLTKVFLEHHTGLTSSSDKNAYLNTSFEN